VSGAKHTPGPWMAKHREGSDGMWRTEVFSPTYGGIATCDWTPQNLGLGVTGTYREANARLIAAAPLLLEKLETLLSADAALRHATFRPYPAGEWYAQETLIRELGEKAREAREAARAAIAAAKGDA